MDSCVIYNSRILKYICASLQHRLVSISLNTDHSSQSFHRINSYLEAGKCLNKLLYLFMDEMDEKCHNSGACEVSNNLYETQWKSNVTFLLQIPDCVDRASSCTAHTVNIALVYYYFYWNLRRFDSRFDLLSF